MGSSPSGAFAIQFTPELVLKLSDDNADKPKRRRSTKSSKPKVIAPPPPAVARIPQLPSPALGPLRTDSKSQQQELQKVLSKLQELQQEEMRITANVERIRREEKDAFDSLEKCRAEEGELIQRREERERAAKEEEDERKNQEQELQAVAANALQPLMTILQQTEKRGEELHKAGLGELEDIKQRAEELRQKQFTPPLRSIPCIAEKEACTECLRTKKPLECRDVVYALKQCSQRASLHSHLQQQNS